MDGDASPPPLTAMNEFATPENAEEDGSDDNRAEAAEVAAGRVTRRQGLLAPALNTSVPKAMGMPKVGKGQGKGAKTAKIPSEKDAPAEKRVFEPDSSAPLPTWMSFEEKALAQGVQLLDLNNSPPSAMKTTPVFSPSPPPAAAQPIFSFSAFDGKDEAPRQRAAPSHKKASDKKKKAALHNKGEKEKPKTLYEKKWDAYNATLASSKLPKDPTSPGPMQVPVPITMSEISAGFGAPVPTFPPLATLKPVAPLVPFALTPQALAPRLDVLGASHAPNTKPPEMAGEEPFLSLAFQEQPLMTDLPANLRALILTGVKMPVMPPEIFALTSLTKLNYGMNDMKDVPSDIARLTLLSHLDLSDNKLTTLPPNIGSLVNIKRLFLHQNCFIALPSSIGRLRSLCQLYLHGNTLTSLPPEVGSLTNLGELFLQNNYLKELPASLGQLRQLRWLNISDNDLTKLPQSMGRLCGILCTLICENVRFTDPRYLNLAWLAQQPPEVTVGASTLSADVATLMNRHDFSDLTITCNAGVTIQAHRAIVHERCKSMTAQFTYELASQVKAESHTALLAHPAAEIAALLTFLYLGTHNNTSGHFGDLLVTGAFSDLTLVTEGVQFQVHKGILSCRCTYWANLFSSGMKESREERLNVEEVSAAALRLLLEYLYTDECAIDGDTAVELLQAADRYQLHRLTEKVEFFLAESLEVENILDLWEVSDNYHAEQLNRRCLHVLASAVTWQAVRETEAYTRLESNAALKAKLMKALRSSVVVT